MGGVFAPDKLAECDEVTALVEIERLHHLGLVPSQFRVITDRLVRWATRDGGDAAQAVGAVRSVLDEFLPGR